MAALESFNERMVAEATLFRLVKSAGAGPLGADAMSYDLCQLDADNQANFTVCYHIQDVRDDVAVRIAEAFLAGCRWARESNPAKSTRE